MIIFVGLTNILLITSLISLLSNSLSRVSSAILVLVAFLPTEWLRMLQALLLARQLADLPS